MVKHTKKKRYTITNKSNKKSYTRTNKSNKKGYARNYKVKKNLRKTRKIMKGGKVSVDYANLLLTSINEEDFETTHDTGKNKGSGKYYTHRRGTKPYSRPHIHWKEQEFMGFPSGNKNTITNNDDIASVKNKIENWLINVEGKPAWVNLFGEMLRKLNENSNDYIIGSRKDTAEAAEAQLEQNRIQLKAKRLNILNQLHTLIVDDLNYHSVSDSFPWVEICASTLKNVAKGSYSMDILESIEKQITLIKEEFVDIDISNPNKYIRYVKKYKFLKAWCRKPEKFRLENSEPVIRGFIKSVSVEAINLTESDEDILFEANEERNRRKQAEAGNERAAEDRSAEDISAQDISAKDISAEDISAKDISAQDNNIRAAEDNSYG